MRTPTPTFRGLPGLLAEPNSLGPESKYEFEKDRIPIMVVDPGFVMLASRRATRPERAASGHAGRRLAASACSPIVRVALAGRVAGQVPRANPSGPAR